VTAHREIDIAAPPVTVWELHTDVNAWPTWQVDVTEAHVDGAFELGASFAWASYGFGVTSTVYDLAERSRVLRGGTADGITGIHEWRFDETPGGVHVTTAESFAGDPVSGDPAGMQAVLDSSLQAWLAHLKDAAEARSPL
jgi:hypothetical protein